MSSLSAAEKSKLEQLLSMSSGYVLNFSDRSFGEFFADFENIDIHSERYTLNGNSKAKKLRAFWKIESDPFVGAVLNALIEHWVTYNPNPGPEESDLAKQCRAIANRLISGGPNLVTLIKTAVVFDLRYLAEQLQRIERSLSDDPSLAIGTAKELVETCCKTILAERGKRVSGSPDVPTLTKETFRELKLVPEGISDSAHGSEVIRRLLGNLATIANGLAELRGLYGTGHGKHGKAAGLSRRHAKLAVGAAAALTTFLFETHNETKS
jgi:hypothetical protein